MSNELIWSRNGYNSRVQTLLFSRYRFRYLVSRLESIRNLLEPQSIFCRHLLHARTLQCRVQPTQLQYVLITDCKYKTYLSYSKCYLSFMWNPSVGEFSRCGKCGLLCFCLIKWSDWCWQNPDPGRQLADDRIKWKLGNLVWRQVEEVSKFRHIGETQGAGQTLILRPDYWDRAGGYWRAGAKTCQHGTSLTLLNIQVAMMKQ